MASVFRKTVPPFILLIFIVCRRTTQEDIQLNSSECTAIGMSHIYVSWLPTRTGNYSVYFCHLPSPFMCTNLSEFRFGCMPTLQGTPGSQQQCNVGPAAASDFPNAFNYAIRTDIDGKIQYRGPIRCQLSMLMRCNQMTGLRLIPVKKRVLQLSWDKPDMGSMSHQLCYRIFYIPPDADGARNMTFTVCIEDTFSYTSSPTLLPFTKYMVYVQCALNRKGPWGQLAGPVTALTPEEAPDVPLMFSESPNEKIINEKERNINIKIKFPPKRSWHGIVKLVEVKHCEDRENSTTNSTVTEFKFTGSISRIEFVVLPLLCRKKRYTVTAKFCTMAGCSPPSTKLTIDAEGAQDKPIEYPSTGDTTPYYLYIIGGCVAVVLFIVIAVLIYRYFKRSGQQMPLEERVPITVDLIVDSDQPSSSYTAEYDHPYSSAVSAGSLSRSLYTADASSLASQRTEQLLASDSRDFRTASVRTLHSASSLPCMASSEMIDLNEISEEVQRATPEVRRDNVSNLSNYIPCMTSSEMIDTDLNEISEEVQRATPRVRRDNVSNLSNYIPRMTSSEMVDTDIDLDVISEEVQRTTPEVLRANVSNYQLPIELPLIRVSRPEPNNESVVPSGSIDI